MDNDNITYALNALRSLYRLHSGKEVSQISPLPAAGSNRRYFRMATDDYSVIGVYNPDPTEQHTFMYLCSHFLEKGLPVPLLFEFDPESGTCLLQDLGDETLLNYIEKNRTSHDFMQTLQHMYQSILVDLIRFQLEGDEGLDYQMLHTTRFDDQSMHWDLNYFKYYFLKPSGIKFDESELEKNFQLLVSFLSGEELVGFMYRDFQARNIMLQDHKLFYIDFQGGRKGPLQYDLVSLLFQVKAALPDALKLHLMEFYLDRLKDNIDFDIIAFRKRLNGFVLLRLLQVMGAYGYRGWFERKPHFLESIPKLQSNLSWVLENEALPGKLATLREILTEIYLKMEKESLVRNTQLTININSFSYRRGIPYDSSGHGGGFVFDCRLLPNPGRFEEYKDLTGKDAAVITYLQDEPQVLSFVENCKSIVSQASESYLKAGYTNLQVNFGCTGGRHRSVYCAEKLAEDMRWGNDIIVNLNHKELPNL